MTEVAVGEDRLPDERVGKLGRVRIVCTFSMLCYKTDSAKDIGKLK